MSGEWSSIDGCGWRDAIDWQTRLWRWCENPYSAAGLLFAKVASPLVGEDSVNERHMSREFIENVGEPWAGAVGKSLLSADPWWVDEDILDVVSFAAKSMPTEPVHKEEIFTPAAFLLFPKALPLDIGGDIVGVRAFTWDTRMMEPDTQFTNPYPGVIVTIWCHVGDDADTVSVARNTKNMFVEDGRGDLVPDLLPMQGRLLPYHDDDLWDDPDRRRELGENEPMSWLIALWRFVQQEVIAAERMQGERGLRRSAMRDGFQHQGYVTKIRLRKTGRDNAEECESDRHLQTRHIRSGHWRAQWFPSVQLHRPLWIQPTVVGPEGAPLIVRKARGIVVNR